LKRHEEKSKFGMVIEETEGEDGSFGVSFTPNQLAAAATMNAFVEQRAKDITQIAQSINELSALVKDISVLVIEQGSILDRIDYNVEQTDRNVTDAITDIGKAEKSQKSYRNKLCMFMLCIGILLMVIVVLFRLFLK